MGDVFDFGRVFHRAAVHGDEHAAGVGDHMRVGEDAVFSDDETGADAATETAGVPWGLVVGYLGGDLNAQDRAIDIGRCGENGVCEQGDKCEVDQSHGSAQG